MSTTSNETLDEITVVNPFSLKKIATVPLNDWQSIDSYLNKAQKLFSDRDNWLPAYKRIDILKKTAEIMQSRNEELAFQIANEGGKPLVDARVEVARAIDGVNLCIKELSHLSGEEIPMDLTQAGENHIAFSTREPIGTVVAISAFNHPLNLIVHQVAPAVAVGCPFLVKPAGTTPLSCQSFINILYEAGLPKDWGRFVLCNTQDAEKMVTDKRVAFFSFIGSAKVGWELRSKLAPGTRCALEHGGVAPVIVDETANIEAMIPSLVKGGFYHSGQVCVSVQRIYVPQSKANEIAKQLVNQAQNLKVGDAIEENTDCGPLITPNEVKRVHQWVEEAKNSGGQILCGGHALSETTYAPTVILNPPKDATISTREIFGPVICIYSYDDIDDAIKQANALDFAFQAAIYTQNLQVATQSIRALNASAVMVNEHTAFRVDWMPFTGRKQSGYGVGGISHTMHDLTQIKMAVIKI